MLALNTARASVKKTKSILGLLRDDSRSRKEEIDKRMKSVAESRAMNLE